MICGSVCLSLSPCFCVAWAVTACRLWRVFVCILYLHLFEYSAHVVLWSVRQLSVRGATELSSDIRNIAFSYRLGDIGHAWTIYAVCSDTWISSEGRTVHCSKLQASHRESGRLTTPHFWMLFWRNLKRDICYYSIIGMGWSHLVCCGILKLTHFRFRAASLTHFHHVSQ